MLFRSNIGIPSWLLLIASALQVFFVMTIAAAEAAVGLALAVTIFKKFKEVNIRFFEHMKG